uniref:Integrase catalytic domain-containing protein n=1 Tax=Panagrolaimus davidi TaxID=227884 RepID=A0A914Q7G3_9BILA
MDAQMEIAENREALEEAVVVMYENSENNGMEIAENQQALEAAKEEVEKIWRNAFKVEAYESIKADDLYKEIVEAIKKKERNEKFTREQKKEYNWSTRRPQKVKKSVTVLPILSERHNSRCQMDLIDFQAKPDGEFNFILNYQDHFSKYCLLRPLKRKTAENVAEVLSQIFADFGPPKILQTDNGREFKNSKVGSVCEKFGVKFIHGTPRHSQSQGSIERSNQDVENILQTMMADNKTAQWVSLLQQVQLAKNKRSHKALNFLSPYEVHFGQGHVHCDCLMKCETRRCKCKREGRLCNSRCHNQRDCCNK